MALAQSANDDVAFVRQIATNIKAVLAMRRLTATEAAKLIGMSTQVFSQRMTGASRWLAVDLDRLARALEVNVAVLLAHDEAEFRQRLTTSGYKPMNAVDWEGQMVLMERDLLVRDQPLLAIAT